MRIELLIFQIFISDIANPPQIAKAVHEEVVTRDMVPAFVKLLKDTEAEVRTAIAGQIPGM